LEYRPGNVDKKPVRIKMKTEIYLISFFIVFIFGGQIYKNIQKPTYLDK
jgi:hypothetical protein